MGRAPCCDKNGLKKGPWTPEEDQKLIDYIQKHGHGSWRTLPKNAGLSRCGKSCRLRWTNYLRPDIKRGRFSFEEEETIIQLHSILGNKWSAIAARLPGRTDNEIKNYWNTHIRKRLIRMGIDPVTHAPRIDLIDQLSALLNPMLIYNSGQLGLSRLLGIDPLANSELLWLASNLLQSQNPNLLQAQQLEPSPSFQLQNLAHQYGSQNAGFSNVCTLGDNLVQADNTLSYNNDGMVQNMLPCEDQQAPFDFRINPCNNIITHESGLSTAVSSPALNSSYSTYLNSSSNEDDKESYSSSDYWLNFQIPDLLDGDFM